MNWQPRYTAYTCLGLLGVLGGFLLYLKLRSFRHNPEENTEISNNTTTVDNMEHNPNYDNNVRGYRNNNPLNIRLSSNKWQGEVVPSGDKSFCQFKTMAYGFRAAMVNIRSYITKHNCNTLQEIINRWAPWSDGNNPVGYANKVMKRWSDTFPDGDVVIDYKNQEQMTRLVYAMAIVENGSEPQMSDCINAFKMM